MLLPDTEFITSVWLLWPADLALHIMGLEDATGAGDGDDRSNNMK